MKRIPEWVERRRRKKAERLRRKQAARIAHGRRLTGGQDLGQFGDIFRLQHTSWWWRPAVVVLLLFLIFGVPSLAAYGALAEHLTRFEWGTIGLPLVVGSWAIGIFLLLRTGQDRDPGHDEWVYCCDAGFVHVDDRTHATPATRWDQVVAVHRPWIKVESSEGDPYFLPAGQRAGSRRRRKPVPGQGLPERPGPVGVGGA